MGNFSGPFDPRSFLWDFEECSPYTVRVCFFFFEHTVYLPILPAFLRDRHLFWEWSNRESKFKYKRQFYLYSNFRPQLLARFGLKDEYTWDQLWEGIDDLNSKAKGAAFYKLFLLGRHGHNERKCLVLILWPWSTGQLTDNIKSALGADYDGFVSARISFSLNSNAAQIYVVRIRRWPKLDAYKLGWFGHRKICESPASHLRVHLRSFASHLRAACVTCEYLRVPCAICLRL